MVQPDTLEPNRWVNWSELAGQLANIEKAFAVKVNALFLTRRLHQAHQDPSAFRDRLTAVLSLKATHSRSV